LPERRALLLELESLDEAQRRSIENLLSDEETRYEAARGT
jgi:hypothetical protein